MTMFVQRTPEQLMRDQRTYSAAWQLAAQSREHIESARRENREVQTEARRRIAALRRVNVALLERSQLSIVASQRALEIPRVVVVHRQEWMRRQLGLALTEQGLLVVATCDDGADCLGIAVAEQPDLVVVESRLPSFPAVDLLGSLREFSPRSFLAAQTESDDDVQKLIDAGASAVFSRRIPVPDACGRLVGFIRDRPEPVLVLA